MNSTENIINKKEEMKNYTKYIKYIIQKIQNTQIK